MIRKINHKNNFYFVTSADWEGTVHCSSASEAANSAIENVLREFGKETKLAPGIVVFDLGKYGRLGDADISTRIFYTPSVLADIGMHTNSKKVDKIMQTLSTDSDTWDFPHDRTPPEES